MYFTLSILRRTAQVGEWTRTRVKPRDAARLSIDRAGLDFSWVVLIHVVIEHRDLRVLRQPDDFLDVAFFHDDEDGLFVWHEVPLVKSKRAGVFKSGSLAVVVGWVRPGLCEDSLRLKAPGLRHAETGESYTRQHFEAWGKGLPNPSWQAKTISKMVQLVLAAARIRAEKLKRGDPTPSEADIVVTRDLIRAGQLLKIQVLDHVIFGQRTEQRPRDFVSLRELGYFSWT